MALNVLHIAVILVYLVAPKINRSLFLTCIFTASGVKWHKFCQWPLRAKEFRKADISWKKFQLCLAFKLKIFKFYNFPYPSLKAILFSGRFTQNVNGMTHTYGNGDTK